MLTVDLLLGRVAHEARPDVIIAVVDASNLERHLYLVTQLFELGVPVVIALNMYDVATKQDVRIDATELERSLGVRVIPTQANRGVGIEQLVMAVKQTCEKHTPSEQVKFPKPFEVELDWWAGSWPGEPRFLLRRAILDIGGSAEAGLIARHGANVAGDLTAAQRNWKKPAARCPPWKHARATDGFGKSLRLRWSVRSTQPRASLIGSTVC